VFLINKSAAELAKKATAAYMAAHPGELKFVAGAVGPTNKTLSVSPSVENPAFRGISYDEVVDAYYQQLEGLYAGGVDMFLVETIFDTLNAKAAVYALEKFFADRGVRIPVFISGTIVDNSGRTLSGQTNEAFWNSISHAKPLAVGLNCALGATDMKKYIANLSACADCFVFCYPNAGLPNAMGGYDQKGVEMAEEIRPFCDDNLVNAIGGCCGSTPEHIAAIVAMASAYPPRQVHEVEPLMRISGLEPLNYQPNASNMRATFLNLGERCNVAGSALFKKAIINNDYDTALAIALKQVQQGADVLDINMDDGLIDGVAAMTKFVNLCISGVSLGGWVDGQAGRVGKDSGFTAEQQACMLCVVWHQCAGAVCQLCYTLAGFLDQLRDLAGVQHSPTLLLPTCPADMPCCCPCLVLPVLCCLRADPEISRVPFMIDSSKFHIVEAGLKCAQGKCIVNSISLKEGEEKFKEQATIVKNHGAAVVVMAFDETGQAAGFEDKVSREKQRGAVGTHSKCLHGGCNSSICACFAGSCGRMQKLCVSCSQHCCRVVG
jgi:methionine synthase I (cobalamin-dependent)